MSPAGSSVLVCMRHFRFEKCATDYHPNRPVSHSICTNVITVSTQIHHYAIVASITDHPTMCARLRFGSMMLHDEERCIQTRVIVRLYYQPMFVMIAAAMRHQ